MPTSRWRGMKQRKPTLLVTFILNGKYRTKRRRILHSPNIFFNACLKNGAGQILITDLLVKGEGERLVLEPKLKIKQ